MDNEERSKIDKLAKNLYSRTSPETESKKPRFHAKDFEAPSDWKHEEVKKEDMRLNDHYEEKGSTFFHKMLIGSLVFFLLALLVGVFILLKGSNIVSANNVDISITGPVSIAGGDVLSLDVKVENKNNVQLKLVDLAVEYPTGTVNPDDTTKELVRSRVTLPDINPDSSTSKTIKAVLYGEENSKKQIDIKVEYRVPGSNAVFYKEKTYDVFINSSPISLAVSSFKEVNSGQEFDITAQINSNSKEVLKNILLKADYPFGFTFVKSVPQGTGDKKSWNLGDIKPGEQRTIKISGKIDGQDNDERVFKFAVGTQSAKNATNIGTQFLSASQAISLKKPFLSANVALNGTSGDASGNNGEPVTGTVTWSNNLPTHIINGQIKVTLSGSGLDQTSVSADKGFYRSSDNTIVWDQTTAPELADIAAFKGGSFTFRLTPKVPNGVTNPLVNVDLSVKATRLSEQNVPEQIVSTGHSTLHVVTSMDLAGQILRSVGPFTNQGPIPPKADQKTTYTVVWTVSNTSSTISNAVLRSSLPSYVKWLGVVSPSSEKITYNEQSGGLVWNVGTIPAYTGIKTPRREVAFQIEFDPSISQVGQSPVLVNESTLTGADAFSNSNLTATKTALTTRFSTDPTYKSGDEQVRN